MPQFFGDIEDMANCLDTMSENDYTQTKLSYEYSTIQQAYDVQQLCSLTCAMALTETNLHIMESQIKK